MKVDLVLDSGAYTSWRKKLPLTVEEYGDFILEHQDSVSHAVNLDQIPGEFGRVPSPSEVDASAKKGWDNFQALRKRGIESVPVFHQGERMYWLEKMIEEGCEYIGISPANDRTTAQKMVWLDEVFNYLCGDEGYPKIKTHGFGVTALPILYRYPWFSIDSATWLMVGAYGGAMIPVADVHGKPDFMKVPRIIHFSLPTDVKKLSLNYLSPERSYSALGKQKREYVEKYVADQGFTIKGLRTDYRDRQKLCARFFKICTQHYTPPPFHARRTGFFNDQGPSRTGQTEFGHGTTKMIYTITTSYQHSNILRDEGIRDRLVTYYYFKTGSGFDIEQYVKEGSMPMPDGYTERKAKKQALEQSRTAAYLEDGFARSFRA